MDDWKEQFEKEFVDEKRPDLLWDYVQTFDVETFISSLLSSQEQKHKKEIEELIEDLGTIEFTATKPEDTEMVEKADVMTEYLNKLILPNIQKQLRAKYLTKGKE